MEDHNTSKLEEPAMAYGMWQESDLMHLVDRVRKGISFSSFHQLVRWSSFTWPDWSRFLHLSERSMQRYKQESKTFDMVQSEKILEIGRLYRRGVEVFGDKQRWDIWLNTPCMAMGGEAPKSFLDNSFGIQLVHDELGRIEHGIFA